MVWNKYEQKGAHFISTSLGIVTAENIWFHTTENAINDYIDGLLDHIPIDELISNAVHWVKSASNLSLLFCWILAIYATPHQLLIGTIVFFIVCYYLRSALVAPSFNWLAKILNMDVLLIGGSLIVFSYLGIIGKYANLGISLAFYLLFKLELLRRGADSLYHKLNHDNISMNDRILKMLLVKYAIKYNIDVQDTSQYRETVMKLFRKKKSK